MARNPLSPYRGVGLLGGDPFALIQREMNRLFDEMAGAPGLPSAGGASGAGSIIDARMNVSETDRELRISAEMPGVQEQDIDVSLNDDILTIRGEKRMERKDEKENFHFVERSYGTFQRSVRLPFPVDPEQVRAQFENGVLTVTLPKSAPQERTRKIQVQRGGQAGGGQMLQGEAGSDQGRQGSGPQGDARAAGGGDRIGNG